MVQAGRSEAAETLLGRGWGVVSDNLARVEGLQVHSQKIGVDVISSCEDGWLNFGLTCLRSLGKEWISRRRFKSNRCQANKTVLRGGEMAEPWAQVR